MSKTIVGLYDDRSTAYKVVQELQNLGFGKDHLRFASNAQGDSTGYEVDAARDASPEALTRQGVPADQASFYAEGVRRGASLVVARVHDDDVDRAVDVMGRHNPVRYEDRSTEYAAYDASAGAYDEDQAATERARFADQQTERLREIEEHLQVGKRDVVRGGVRVHQVVDTDTQTETLRLREEHVTVDRTNVNRPLTGAEADAAFEEKSIEMVERGEEAVVSKEAVVTGEVTLRKDVDEREETVSDQVRRTRVEVEDIDGDRTMAGGDMDDDYRRHFQSTYGSSGRDYDAYAPAYRYGASARGTYRDRDYADVEPDLRRDYESRYGNDSAWDDVKDAVRHGWERTKAAVR